MRHRVKVNKFNRDTKHRESLFKNLVRALVEHGSITTTEQKAKEVKRLADRLIGKAKTDSVHMRRQLHEFFGKRDVVNTLVDRIAPLFTDRVSGFTTTTAVGIRRGDNTRMVAISLVTMPEVVGLKNPNPTVIAEPKKTAPKAKAAAKTVKKA